MSRPFLLAQLSDPHIGATWASGDPVAALAAAVDSLLALRPAPDAVLVTGDLAENATDREYEQVRELLAPLRAPLYVLPGNHDDREALRRHFGIPGAGGAPVQYAVDLEGLRLVVLDTTVPGEDAGALDAERLAWLDAALAARADVPTLVAMHHPPIATGIPAWDEMGLRPDDRRALRDVVGRHPQVQRLVAGHLHRVIVSRLAGSAVLAVPSTYAQGRLDFGAQRFEPTADPAAFAVHTVIDGEVVSHIEPVTRSSRPAARRPRATTSAGR